ncbi:hypothetical protein [Sphingomonas aerolata]|uniref:hypothetical protein n=1 Tax=Sphingomonas aerolata TaxID=185951 RepID=UPI002FE29267
MQQNVNGRSPVFGTLLNSDRYLVYVPTGIDDPRVSYDTPETGNAFNAFIEGTKLSDYRGQIAAKNIVRNRAFTRIDLHLEQELPTGIGSSRMSIFADINNLPNLLNSKWGGLRQLGFPYTAAVVQVQCLAAPAVTGVAGTPATTSTQACAQYRYSSFRSPNETVPNLTASLYAIRVGARFTF